MTTTVLVMFAVLAVMGMPLAFVLGFSSLAGLWVGGVDFVILPQRMMHAIDSFPLMAIPLFMIAGELMVEGNVMNRLIDFANSIVGRVHGGLAHVTIITGAILASVNGAAVASASALGSSMVPTLRKYYDDGYISGIIAAAANLGPIIPPSGAMIMYAIMAGGSRVSVGALFISGIIPGLLITAGTMLAAAVIAKRRGFPLTGEPFSFANALHHTRKAFIVFMMPVLVVGGIVAGAFTPTEGAGVAVAYAALIGFFITKQLKFSMLPAVMFRAAVGSSVVAALIAFASTITFVFTIDLLPMRIATTLQGLTTSPMVFLLIVMLTLVVVGMFLESISAYIMLVPLLAPVADTYGINPLYFGFLFVLNLVIGMMTPPVGILLFVMCGITRISMAEMIKNSIVYISIQYGVLVLCIVFPALCLWLPKVWGF